MPIEIKELVIRAVVDGRAASSPGGGAGGETGGGNGRLVERCVEESVEQVLEILRSREER